MPPHIQKRVRILLSSMAVLMLAPLTFSFALAGVEAVPRAQCAPLEDRFCSDYGRWYLAFALVCAFMLFIALRLINRQPRYRDEDVQEDPDR